MGKYDFSDAGKNYPKYALRPRSPYPEIANFGACRAAAQAAYKMAGIEDPYHEIDVFELHDAYTTSELQTYEDLMLCEVGKGKEIINEGQSYRDGDVPSNMSGGLLGMGHPVGATGIASIVEIFWQLRQEIGKHHGDTDLQVDSPEVGLAHSHAGTGTALAVNILQI